MFAGTPLLSVLYFALAAFLGALGQFLYKAGAERADAGPASYLFNWRLLAGVVCYVAVMVLFVAALKRGAERALPDLRHDIHLGGGDYAVHLR